MTPKSFAIVACRLLAVWFFAQATRGFADAISKILEARSTGFPPIVGFPPLWQSVASLSLPLIVDLGASFVLWLGASVLAENATRDVETGVAHQSKNEIIGWQAVGFSLIGLYVFVQGLNTLLSYFISKILLSASDLDAFPWPSNLYALVQFVVGLVLLFRAQNTIRVLDYVQRGGRDESPSS